MQVDAEKTWQQNTVAKLELAQLHVADKLVNDDLPADSSLRLHGPHLSHSMDAELNFRRCEGCTVAPISEFARVVTLNFGNGQVTIISCALSPGPHDYGGAARSTTIPYT